LQSLVITEICSTSQTSRLTMVNTFPSLSQRQTQSYRIKLTSEIVRNALTTTR